MDLSMSELLMYLLQDRSFYARIANGLQRVVSPGMGTMAVGVYRGRLSLFYDPEFLKKSSMRFMLFVLDHEMYHLAMDHIPRYLELLANFPDPLQRERAKHIHNIAMDCAVNTNLRNSPHFEIARTEFRDQVHAAMPEGVEKPDACGLVLPELYGLPLDKAFERYLDMLMPRVRFHVTQGGEGDGDPVSQELMKRIMEDSTTTVGKAHDRWGEKREKDDDSQGKQPGKLGKGQSPGEGEGDGKDGDNPWGSAKSPQELQALADKLRTQAKSLLRRVYNEAKRDRGTVPGDVAEFLEGFLTDPIVPWWELLTSRVKATKRSKPSRGLQRPNRVLQAMAEEDPSIIPALGKLKDPKYRVFFVTDTSGSMSSESLEIACSELTHLLNADEDMEVRWIQGDSAVHFDQLFTTGMEIKAEVHGRGGTDFNAYFAHMAQYMGNDETAPDIVIVYTDGYAPAVDYGYRLSSEVPVVWLLTRGGTASSVGEAGYGDVITCDENQNTVWEKTA